MTFPNDTSRYDSIEIDGVLDNALPVGALVFDTVTGMLYRSTDAATPTFSSAASAKHSASILDSTELNTLAAPTAFATTVILAADTMLLRTVLKIRAVVRIKGVNGADTFIFALRVGGTTMVANVAVTAAANNRFILEGSLLFRAAPGAAVEASPAFHAYGTISNVVASGPISAVPTFATDGALTVDVLATFSSANAGNQAVLESLVTELA